MDNPPGIGMAVPIAERTQKNVAQIPDRQHEIYPQYYKGTINDH
jgi:hypothetical protein